ncbi:hypothetical protein H6F96_15935 [Microcoleus sp. FACHB-53]|nr:hypothetical protein [Microcoleus sp. FACHB-53]
MARKEDLKPIALTGKRVGQEVDANEEGLTHELCRELNLCCPECYQFVHLRQSDKITSYFAHYDVEDKSCKYREDSSSSSTEDHTATSDSKGQDLGKIQEQFENIFYWFYEEIHSFYSLNLENIAILGLEDITNKCQQHLKCIKDLIFIKLINKQGKLEETRNNNHKIYLTVLKVLSIDMNKHLLRKLIKSIIGITHSNITETIKCTQDATASINEILINDLNRFIESSVHNIIEVITNIDWTTQKNIIANDRIGYYIPFYSKETEKYKCDENSNIKNSKFNFPESKELLEINALASLKKQNIFPFNLTAESIKLSKEARLVEKYPYSLVTDMGYVFEVQKDGTVISVVQLDFETGLSIQLPAKASVATKKIFRLVEDFFLLEGDRLYNALLNQILYTTNNNWIILCLGLKALSQVKVEVDKLSIFIEKDWLSFVKQVINDIDWPTLSTEDRTVLIRKLKKQLSQELPLLGVHVPTLEKTVNSTFKNLGYHEYN